MIDKAIRPFRAFWKVIHRRGVGYFAYLLAGVLVPKVIYRLLYGASTITIRRVATLIALGLVALVFAALALFAGLAIAVIVVVGAAVLALIGREALRLVGRGRLTRRSRELTDRARASHGDRVFLSWGDWPVDPAVREAIESARAMASEDELVIGRIDQDGRVLGHFGSLPGIDNVDEREFVEKDPYVLELVLIGDRVLLRKDFRAHRSVFLNEWHNLATLCGETSVPAIYRVDEDGHRLYLEFIAGPTMRSTLAAAGARILDFQVADDPALAGLNPAQRTEAVTARGRELIADCFSEAFLVELEDELDRIHSCGIAGLDVKTGNVIVEQASGRPRLVDFERPQFHRSTSGKLFCFRRDRDRIAFNETYGRRLITERSARDALDSTMEVEPDPTLGKLQRKRRKDPYAYAPVDFGNGLTVGRIWSTESGMGRWEYLRDLGMGELVRGSRILDLGTGSGVPAMMWLRNGAREVVGVERSPQMAAFARLVHRLFEWRDMRSYRFDVREDDMLEVVSSDLGSFDLVTSMCSLYYISEEDMRSVVQTVSMLTSTIVVQTNLNTANQRLEESYLDEKLRRASLGFLKTLLEENGFSEVEVHAPKHFSRPWLVGRTSGGQEPVDTRAAASAIPG